ncbi:MAG: GNAT family N-acetyltransferase [Chloroflexi bacterium AL-W]|nr:GNAT family N-acetyltransferase [Chloroflexi bacterium AL-N1]NOK67923.1 GNAT family N-acetyltransferase [Chloroflexi bacterium AL-N10]NOK73263.1 GNAT family N-acetyltransferase [Chloroflexi bacterium AL-N5]NOK83177.1 GNAT family N-acetyltransferase [Chloroflexi bacterium AL-W]NOK87594.1 GNAT family N-acetyltransferase [Chloroflexi bacterium AL-N15]
MHVTLSSATTSKKPILANLLQLYLHDCSVFDERGIDGSGLYHHASFESYWTQPDHHSFLIYADERLMGFVFINRTSLIHSAFDGYAVTDFFVLRRYRRLGIGRAAAETLFNRYPGKWEVATFAANVPAQAFWRSVIDQYTAGSYTEIWQQTTNWRGHIRQFATKLPLIRES